jgi:hypothetical protein
MNNTFIESSKKESMTKFTLFYPTEIKELRRIIQGLVFKSIEFIMKEIERAC